MRRCRSHSAISCLFPGIGVPNLECLYRSREDDFARNRDLPAEFRRNNEPAHFVESALSRAGAERAKDVDPLRTRQSRGLGANSLDFLPGHYLQAGSAATW